MHLRGQRIAVNSANPVIALAGGLGTNSSIRRPLRRWAGDAPLLLLTGSERTRQHVSGAPDLAKFKLPGNVSRKLLTDLDSRTNWQVLRPARFYEGRARIRACLIASAAPLPLRVCPRFFTQFWSPCDCLRSGRGVSYDARLARKQSSQLLIGYLFWRCVADMFVTANMRNLLLDAVPNWLDDSLKRHFRVKPPSFMCDWRLSKELNIGLLPLNISTFAIHYHRAHGHSGCI